MPELTVIHIVLLAVVAAIGAVAGWIFRGKRSAQEKAAVSAGWQEQIDAQRREHDRLLEQNKSLMDRVSHFQASLTDSKNRAKELSTVVQEAFERRDQLQREIKDIRGNLEAAVVARDQLASSMEAHGADTDLLQERDERIDKLSHELANWQNRLPPLIERFRIRNEEANQLEAELDEARARIRDLEELQTEAAAHQTRIEPVHDPAELTDGLDASNDASDIDENFETWIEEVDVQAEPEAEEETEAEEEPEAETEPEAEAEPEAEEEHEAEAEAEADYAAELEPHDDRDDLKMIKGVGPAIEKTLNEIGILSLRQIADMSEYDIDRVARRLKGFHSRIYREDWIGQARALLDQAAHG